MTWLLYFFDPFKNAAQKHTNIKIATYLPETRHDMEANPCNPKSYTLWIYIISNGANSIVRMTP